jgi:hypothetical protein
MHGRAFNYASTVSQHHDRIVVIHCIYGADTMGFPVEELPLSVHPTGVRRTANPPRGALW